MQQYYVNKPQDVYRRQAVFTASPVELIVMLYDGCRKFLLMAQKAIVKNDPATAHKHLIRCQDIIGELVNSLDMRYPISEELLDIYEFLINQMVEININKNAEGITPLIEIVGELRDAWQEIAEKQEKGALSLAED